MESAVSPDECRGPIFTVPPPPGGLGRREQGQSSEARQLAAAPLVSHQPNPEAIKYDV